MADVSLYAGEEKTITLTYVDSDGDAIDLSGAIMSFAMKYDLDDSTSLVTKVHADFDMTDAASGIVYFDLSDTDTDQDGILDESDSEIESGASGGNPGKGKPDWWCEKHPTKC